MTETTDRIEKRVFLKASRARVWRALTDSTEFGTWFGMRFDGPFVAGASVFGAISPTTMDANTAELQAKFEGMRFELAVATIEPETLFSFRWHPFAIERNVDYSKEPMTLVEFRLEETDGGVWLSVIESGFDKLPASRRAQAFRANDGGWAEQMKLIDKYVTRAT